MGYMLLHKNSFFSLELKQSKIKKTQTICESLCAKHHLNSKESRIGKKPIVIPSNVSVTVKDNLVEAKGPFGERSLLVHPALTAVFAEDPIRVLRGDDDRRSYQLHGLNRTLLSNMITGLASGYSKTLVLSGVGYRAKVEGRKIILSVGYSH